MHLFGTEWLWDQGGVWVWVWGGELGEDIETSVYTQKQNSLKKNNFRAAEVETVYMWHGALGFIEWKRGNFGGKVRGLNVWISLLEVSMCVISQVNFPAQTSSVHLRPSGH